MVDALMVALMAAEMFIMFGMLKKRGEGKYFIFLILCYISGN